MSAEAEVYPVEGAHESELFILLINKSAGIIEHVCGVVHFLQPHLDSLIITGPDQYRYYQ